MLPCSTYVLDHTLPVTPDELFAIVQQFVQDLPSDSSQPLGVYGDVHFTLTGVEWSADHTTIDILAQLSVPRQEEHWRLREADAYELVHAPTIRWDDLSSTKLFSVDVIPSTAEALTARIMAPPSTAAEQLAIRLAAHIVRETATTAYQSHAELMKTQEAAYQAWIEWLEGRITEWMSEKKARDQAWVFPVESRIILRSLHTTVDVFMEELWKHFKLFPPKDVPTDDGYISLHDNFVSGYPDPTRSPSVYLFARHHTVEAGIETSPPTVIGLVILFQGFRRGSERIDVTITCLHRALEHRLESLARMIMDWYPQAHLESKQPTSGLRTSGKTIIKDIDRLTAQRIPSEQPIPSDNGKNKRRGKNIDTAIKVAKARLILRQKGTTVSQQLACQFAGVAPKTLRKYYDDPDVLAEMERLREDRSFLEEIKGISGI